MTPQDGEFYATTTTTLILYSMSPYANGLNSSKVLPPARKVIAKKMASGQYSVRTENNLYTGSCGRHSIKKVV